MKRISNITQKLCGSYFKWFYLIKQLNIIECAHIAHNSFTLHKYVYWNQNWKKKKQNRRENRRTIESTDFSDEAVARLQPSPSVCAASIFASMTQIRKKIRAEKTNIENHTSIYLTSIWLNVWMAMCDWKTVVSNHLIIIYEMKPSHL